MEEELFDWEMIHGSDTESTDSITSEKNSGSSSGIDDGTMILSDHISVDKIADPIQFDVFYSFRVSYGSDSLNQKHTPVSDFEASDEKHDEGEDLAEGGNLTPYEDERKCLFESDDIEVANERYVEDSSKSWPDSVGDELVSGDPEIVNGEEEIVSESKGNGGNYVEVVAVDSAVRSGDESKSREIVWWKMPTVLLKYYAFRIGSVYSISMAAAVMGLVILGRRFYNMKKKDQRFILEVTIDDKKASRVMSQAARLNEMFTEVRRVPVIRPPLPSPGAWPALTLR